ncbi:hypothetical protein ACO0SA_002527 [Hanseniaspora valbyensis]
MLILRNQQKQLNFLLLITTFISLINNTQSFPNNNDHNLLLSFNQYKELIQQQSQQEQYQLNQFEIGEDFEVDITSFISTQSTTNNKNSKQDKFNYASMDCMANIIESSKSNVKHSSNLLNNDLDKSLLFNYNSQKDKSKYVIIELCDLIKINSLEIGNLEQFSNNFKTFRISGKKWYNNNNINNNNNNSGDDDYDGEEEWHDLGTFEYTMPNSIQFFCVNGTNGIGGERPWIKYLKLEILDVEENVDDFYYTPLTVFRVFGKDIFNDVEEKERDMIQTQLMKENDKRIKEEEEEIKKKLKENVATAITSSLYEGGEQSSKYNGFGEEDEEEEDLDENVDFCIIKNPFIKYDLKLASLNTTLNNTTQTNHATVAATAKFDYKDNVLESILKKINFLTSYTQLQSNYMELSFNETVKIINDTYFNNFKKKVSKLEKKI